MPTFLHVTAMAEHRRHNARFESQTETWGTRVIISNDTCPSFVAAPPAAYHQIFNI